MNIQDKIHYIEKMFICVILLICCYKFDKNKNYNFNLTKKLIKKQLKKSKIEPEIVNHINKNFTNYKISGNVNYLVNSSDSECMCLETDTHLYLIFCGTQMELSDPISAIKDIYTDIKLGLAPITFIEDKKIKIHSKYQENMFNDNLIIKISNIVEKINNTKNIIICGHSMGCGLSLFTSLYLSNKFTSTKFELITFNAPKLGNSELNNYLPKNKNIIHYDLTNNNDIVYNFPFCFFNYTHISKKICILKNNEFKIIKTKNMKHNIFNNHSISDHYCKNIISSLFLVIKKFNV